MERSNIMPSKKGGQAGGSLSLYGQGDFLEEMKIWGRIMKGEAQQV